MCRASQVFLEVWGEGSSWEELFESIRAYPEHLKAPYTEADEVSNALVIASKLVCHGAGDGGSSGGGGKGGGSCGDQLCLPRQPL